MRDLAFVIFFFLVFFIFFPSGQVSRGQLLRGKEAELDFFFFFFCARMK